MKKRTEEFFKGYRGRLMASAVAGGVVILGLGAFSLLPIAASPQHVVPQQQHAPQQPMRPVQAATPIKPATPRMIEAGAPFSFADLVERVSPSVVTITVEEQVSEQAAGGFDPNEIPEPFRNFFNQFGQGQGGQSAPRKAIAMGSGFVIDKSGYIVTNNHVIEGGKKITVKFPDGREYEAKLIGTDPATDIALLKVKAEKPLPAVEFGDDRQVRVGDWVIAVGNPFGLSNTVTAGIVSSIGRDVGNGQYNDFIQIDAPINRGNSGGPTFDIQGKVIGMNSMIFSPSGGSVGIGFAIPATTIHDVVAQLQAHGRVSRGYLGVEIQSITPEMAASMGNKNMKGAIVASVTPGGPAASAGFAAGDIVLAVNGKGVEDSRDLTRRVAALPAGATATFSVVHNGAPKILTAKIGAKKDEQVASNNAPKKGAPATTGEAMGLGLAAVTPETRNAYNLDNKVNGVVITRVDPNSDAADKGLQPGDVVISVANHAVRSPQDVKSSVAAAHAAGRDTVLVLVTGQGGQRFVAIKLGA